MAGHIAVVEDSDGLPPGQDLAELALVGQEVVVNFYGKFYAAGDQNVSFDRKCVVILALKKVFVLQDGEHRNLYVIDRESRASLGCMMKVRVFHENERIV